MPSPNLPSKRHRYQQHQAAPERRPQHQRQNSRQYPYPTPNQSPDGQNAFPTPPVLSPRACPRASPRSQPPPPPQPQEAAANASWQWPSSPAPRKLGDTTFRYRDLGDNEIRLLRILPGISSTIICEVLITSLNEPKPYIGISYAWGDSEDTRTILLHGHEFPITVSLWQALQRLRSQAQGVIVWADAVCINQQNVGERNTQVQAMTRIYSLAHEVAIWLGPESEDSDMAIELLVEIGKQVVDFKENQSAYKGHSYIVYNTIRCPRWRQHFKKLVALFDREYWYRLWVIQEVLNATDTITVYCGSAALPWTIYLSCLKVFRENEHDLKIEFPQNNKKFYLSARGHTFSSTLCNRGPGGLRKLEDKGPGIGLLQVLLYHRGKSCTDPRDKVYGILGILYAHVRSQFVVDYSISIREVYINVVEYVLTTTKRLDVICASIHFPRHYSAHKLPSWVPDWSHGTSMPPLGDRYPNFAASGSTDAEFAFSERRTKLKIEAVPIDRISFCGTHLGPPVDIGSCLMAIFQWRLLLIRSVGYDSTAHEAFCRMLNLDQGSSRGSVGGWTPAEWMTWTYYTLATLLRQRYPSLELDAQLKYYADNPENLPDGEQYGIVTFEDCMMSALAGRAFFMTRSGLLCVGSGAGKGESIICVPLGCSTPIILRETTQGYEYLGDCYVDGYMYGKALEELNTGVREKHTYVLH